MKIKKGQAAIVTGASAGLGVHIAEALAKKGVHLVLAARNLKNLEKVRTELLKKYDIKIFVVQTDISKQEDLKRLVAVALEKLGAIHIHVNNAGVEKTMWFGDITREEISEAIDINLKGTMHLTHLVLPHMIEQNLGHIVNISSGTGYLPMAYNEVYATTKAGIIGFTKALRQSLQDRKYNVSASVVAPGFMDGSGMYENMKEQFKVSAPKILGSNPMERLTRDFIVAIEKDKPDVIVSAGFPKLIVAMSILSQRSIERIAKQFSISSFFRSIADSNWAKTVALAATRERYKKVSTNVKNLARQFWGKKLDQKMDEDIKTNVDNLTKALWKIDMKNDQQEGGREP